MRIYKYKHPIVTKENILTLTTTNDRGCLEWTGSRNGNGYGNARFNKRNYPAHKLVYMLLNGSISKGLYVCHKCDNPPCINPAHLFLATHAENMHDRDKKGRGKLPDNTGIKNGMAKLTPEKVREIRALHPAFSYATLSIVFNAPITTLQSALRRETWRSIPPLTKEESLAIRTKYAMQYT